LTDIEIPSENERRAAQLIDFHGRLTDAASGRGVGAWRRVLTSLGCLHAILPHPLLPRHRRRHSAPAVARDPARRRADLPAAQRRLSHGGELPARADDRRASAQGIGKLRHRLGAPRSRRRLHRAGRHPSLSLRAPARAAGTPGTRVERWIARFLDDGGSRGFLRFLDFSATLAQLPRLGAIRGGGDGNLITATFAAPYADPHLEARLAVAARRLRHADPEWLQDRLEAVILLPPTSPPAAGRGRRHRRRHQPRPAAAQFDRRVAVRTGLSARKTAPAEAEELLSAS